MPKKRHMFIALSNPVDGQDDEFHEWYELFHVPECVKAPGFVSGQRFTLSASVGGEPKQRHLALYELEGDDPQAILDGLRSTRDTRTQSSSMDRSSLSMWVFTEAGEKHTSCEGEGEAED